MRKAPAKTKEELRQIADALKELENRKRFRVKDFFVPYPKQQEFFDLGLTKRERLLMAGNQLGKTEAGAFETACHLTGEYPEWWLGRRFDRAVSCWAAGESSLVVRDVQQKKLCGKPGVDDDFGSGLIPKEAFIGKPSLARGITDAFDTIQVRHKPTGGTSVLQFKSYEQGRTKFQGDSKDFIWLDEEPPEDIYTESLARLIATGGMAFMTFTPLNGRDKVVDKFLEGSEMSRDVVIMTIDDVTHTTAEAVMSMFPEYQRQCRLYGQPMQGTGAIFTAAEKDLKCEAFEIPEYWSLLWGIDFGINHPFAAVLIAWDKDADIIYVVRTVRMADRLPIDHAAAMKPWGADIPVAWPQDGTQRREFEGTLTQTAKVYKAHGLHMQDTHAKFPDGSISTEAGIMEMQERMRAGKFKVFSHLSDWFEEYRGYHRKDGVIVKQRDDLLSATRIAIMAKRGARVRERFAAQMRNTGASVKIANGANPDPWGY